VVLNLVDGWHNVDLWKQKLEVLDTVVGNTDGTCLAGWDQLLDIKVCVDVGAVELQVAGPISMFWELGVVALISLSIYHSSAGVTWTRIAAGNSVVELTIWVHAHGPVHQVQIHVIETQTLERDIQSLLDSCVVGTPQLRGDEYLLTLHQAGLKGLLEGSAYFILIAVAVSCVDVTVARLQGVSNGFGHFTWGGLPCSYGKRGLAGLRQAGYLTVLETNRNPRPGSWRPCSR